MDVFNLISQIPLDMVLNIIVLFFIILMIILGLILGIDSTKSLLKALSQKYLLFILILSVSWAVFLYFLLGKSLLNYYSFGELALTFIFSVLILCFTAFKWAEEDSFLLNILINNLKFNSVLNVSIYALIPQIFTFDLYMFCMNFIKSLVLPIILIFLFLPIIYVIAVFNEYCSIYNTLSIFNTEISIFDIFKHCNINLKSICKFRENIDYNISIGKEINLKEGIHSKFRLTDNKIFMNGVLIGKYECNSQMPKFCGKMHEAYTKNKKIHYIVGDWEMENLSDDMAFVYFSYKNTCAKLFLNLNVYPMQLWSLLIEDIYEFELLSA